MRQPKGGLRRTIILETLENLVRTRYQTNTLLVLALLVPAVCVPPVRAQDASPPKRVLVLMPFQVSRPGSVALLRGIEDGLRANYPAGVEMVTDSVAPVPPEPEGFAARMSDWLAYKYGHQHFDAIVSVINPPVPYAVALRDRFWPEVPILFVLQEEERQSFPQAVPRSTQVVTSLSNTQTLRSALDLFPQTEHLVYLEGSSDQDRHANELILRNIRQAFPQLDIIEVQGLSWEETKDRLRSIPDGSIVLIGSFLFDRNHRQLTNPQQAEELSPILGAPLIADSDVVVGKGVVGGSVLSVQGAGKVAGNQLAELLKGADPDRMPPLDVKNSYIVDWRQLRRWGIPESRLPPDATVLYKPPTAWEQYKGYIISVATVLALLLALVAFLFIERQRRRKEEELNSAMLESLPGLALLVSPQGEILRSNQIEAGALGDELGEAAPPGRTYLDCLHRVAGQDGVMAAASVAQVIAGDRISATAEVPLLSGNRWLEIRAIQLPQGQSGSLIVHLDITQRKQAELELIESRTQIYHLNRVAAMGQLAAALAHELSQPLAAILSNAEAGLRFANRESPDLREIREALNDIAQDDRRARGVIQGMRAMLKKQDLKVVPVDLNHIASSVAQMMRNEATLRGMSIQVLLLPSPVMVQGDAIALQQVLLNLASNGLDAMTGTDGARCLTIRTSGESNGKTASVWVDDEGLGVSREMADKLFQPFFTTKHAGLGMGLAICQSILDSLGGRIDVKNRDRRGASFSVTLPRA